VVHQLEKLLSFMVHSPFSGSIRSHMKSTRPAPNLLGGQIRQTEGMLKTRRKMLKTIQKCTKQTRLEYDLFKSIHKTEQNSR